MTTRRQAQNMNEQMKRDPANFKQENSMINLVNSGIENTIVRPTATRTPMKLGQ